MPLIAGIANDLPLPAVPGAVADVVAEAVPLVEVVELLLPGGGGGRNSATGEPFATIMPAAGIWLATFAVSFIGETVPS